MCWGDCGDIKRPVGLIDEASAAEIPGVEIDAARKPHANCVAFAERGFDPWTFGL